MKQHSTLLTIGLLFCGLAYSQVDTSYVVGDTLIKKTYYKDGQLEHWDKYVKGRDMHSYNFSYWYYHVEIIENIIQMV